MAKELRKITNKPNFELLNKQLNEFQNFLAEYGEFVEGLSDDEVMYKKTIIKYCQQIAELFPIKQ
ncbi:MAG: hypothetical protein WBV22_08440 [Anaerolineaceae bacterium]